MQKENESIFQENKSKNNKERKDNIPDGQKILYYRY